MNRRSLFGRFAVPLTSRETAARPEHRRTQLEPLEDRKVLAAIAYVNDNWALFTESNGDPSDGILEVGDKVTDTNDAVPNSITASYGVDAFGTVVGQDFPSLAGSALIHDAIQSAGITDNNGDTVTLMEGAYTESDVAITKSVVFSGSGQKGSATETKIVPEISSARSDVPFPTGSHSGIIIYADSTTVTNLYVNGSGNASTAVGTFAYHNGITTLYDGQDHAANAAHTIGQFLGGVSVPISGNYQLNIRLRGGPSFTTANILYNETPANIQTAVDAAAAAASVPGYVAGDIAVTGSGTDLTTGSITLTYSGASVDGLFHDFVRILNVGLDADPGAPVAFLGFGATTNTGFDYDPIHGSDFQVAILGVTGQARGVPHILVDHVTVENVWYRGIVLSAPSGTNYGRDGSNPENEVANTTVENIGDAGNKTASHIGILIQNLDDYNTGDPGAAAAEIGGNAYGNTVSNAPVGIASNAYGTRTWNSQDGARNDTTYSLNTVNNPDIAAYKMEFLSGGDFINNVASFSPGNSAIGVHSITADVTYLTVNLGSSAATAPKIGMVIENSATGTLNAGPILGLITIVGPGTGVAGSIGILADNNGANGGVNTDTTFLATHSVTVSGFENGAIIRQTNASTIPTTIFADRLNISGNATGYRLGPNNASGNLIINGQFNTTDPVVDPGTTIFAQFLPNILASYADSLTLQETPVEIHTTITSVVVGSSIITVASNPWANGQKVEVFEPSGAITRPEPFGGGGYYIRGITATTVTLHGSKADALANVNPIVVTKVNSASTPGAVFISQSPNDITVATTTAPKPDTIRTGNLTLGTDATFIPQLNGDGAGSATLMLQDFNTSTAGPLVSDIDHVNPWRPAFVNPALLGIWGPTSADRTNGTTLRVGILNQAVNLGAIYHLPSAPLLDVTDYGYLQVRLRNGGQPMNAKNFFVALVDVDGTSDLFAVTASEVNGTALDPVTYSNLRFNLLTPPIRFVAGDGIMNFDKIAGWSVAGDFGSTTAFTDKTLSLEIDDISFVKGPRASNFDVTGTVSLSGAILAASTGALFVASNGQQFTLINNDGTDAVQGTFAGLAEGMTVAVGANNFTISYSGGTNNNDVVLTQVLSSSVTGRSIFYNQSFYDGNNISITAADDAAIDTSKSAYLHTGANATFASITGYDKGINGINIDLLGAGTHSSISSNDFTFKVGNNNNPQSWAAAPAPSAISVRLGAGVSGADRVSITWATGAIAKKWLEVQVLSTGDTGLAATDVFFWGNAVGNSGDGDTATAAPTNNTDELGARNNPKGFGNFALVTFVYDYNKDRSVNATDQLISRNNPTGFGTQLVKINIGTAGPFAPEGGGDGGGDAGIASALAASSGGSDGSADLPVSVAARLEEPCACGVNPDYIDQAVASDDASDDDSADDDADDDSGVDDDLLDSLVAGL